MLNGFVARWGAISIVILGIPLLFFGFSNQIDWGADQAQYIDQARDFVENDFTNEPEILNWQQYAPIARGSGFSLFLAGVYSIFGLNISAYLIFISLSLILAGWMIWQWFRAAEFPPLLALLSVLAIIYNYQVIRLKAEVMPEFTYMALLFAAFLSFQKGKNAWLTASLIGLSISVKDIGWALYLAVIIHQILQAFSNRGALQLKAGLVYLLMPPAVLVLLDLLVFRSLPFEHITWYAPVLSVSSLIENGGNNIAYYFIHAGYFFEQEVWAWMNVVLKGIALIGIILGFFIRWRKQPQVWDLYFVLHVLVLLAYVYQKTAVRFMIPVLPILFFYLAESFQILRLKSKLQYLLPALLMAIVLMSNAKNWQIEWTKPILNDGPNGSQANETWQFIANETDENAVIGFTHPWMTHLFTGRRGFYLDYHDDSYETTPSDSSVIDYILINKNWKKQSASKTQRFEGQTYELVLENEQFSLLSTP